MKTKLKDTPEVKKMAKELGLTRRGNVEEAIREYCVRKVEKIIEPLGRPNGLNQLLAIVSSGLRMKFEEVNTDYDLVEISRKYLSKGELIFGDLHRQLDEKTDAVLIELNSVHPWEPRYVAVIDCRGHKAWRAYFSKWHEVSHVLTQPSQKSFKYRRTPTKKKEPEEQLTDRVAGDLAFYSPLFLPELLARIQKDKRLTFGVIEELRMTVCSEASHEATIRGAVSRTPFPQLFVVADYGFKKNEERRINATQMDLFEDNEIPFLPKLRAVEVIGNIPAQKAGLWIHPNMEVPEESIVTDAYHDPNPARQIYSAVEKLNWWKHSRGALKTMPIYVEATKVGNRVFTLICQS
jgi:hypothetical protein